MSDLEGVLEAKVNLDAKRGTFKYDPSSKANPELIVKIINELGFKAKLVWFQLFLDFRLQFVKMFILFNFKKTYIYYKEILETLNFV